MMDSPTVVALLILAVFFYIIYSEWKRMMLKDLIGKLGKRKLIYDELYAMLVLYQRRNSRMFIRCKEYDTAIKFLIKRGIVGEFNPNLEIRDEDYIQACLVRDQIFSKNWFEISIDSLELKNLLKDRKLIESLNTQDKNGQQPSTASAKI